MNVLLLTDFSSGARHAHKYALNLFAGTKVNYFLLHSDDRAETSVDEMKLDKEEQLANEVETYNDLLPEHTNLTTINTTRSLIDAIRHMMKAQTMDLVVMGASGNSKQFTQELGNNTTSTATKIKCPVLIVFQESIIKDPQNVAFPVDYTDKLQVKCVERLKALPTSHKFVIEVLEINPQSPASSLSKNSKSILDKGLEKLNFIYKKDIDLNIKELETSNKKEFDLISFAAKNLSVYNKVFSQLKDMDKTLTKQPPLYILHA